MNTCQISDRSIYRRNVLPRRLPKRTTLADILNKFEKNTKEQALYLLWKLMVSPYIVTEKLGIYIEGVSPIEPLNQLQHFYLVDDDEVIWLKDELISHYKTIHPYFLDIFVPHTCTEAYNALTQATNMDLVTCVTVFNHCQNLIKYKESEVPRAIYLLKSDRPNQQFGGLKVLDFDKYEASFLEKYTEEIGNLLVALYEDEKEYQKPIEAEDFPQEVENIPFFFGNTQLSPQEEEKLISVVEKAGTISRVLENRTIINDFLYTSNLLTVTGINPLMLLENRKEIQQYLDYKT